MAENNFNLEEYLAEGAEIIVKDAIKATFRNPKESLFLAKFAKLQALQAVAICIALDAIQERMMHAMTMNL